VLYTFTLLYKIAVKADADVLLSMTLAGGFILAGAASGWFVWAMIGSRFYQSVKIGLFSLAAGGVVIILFFLPTDSNVEMTTGEVDAADTNPPFTDPSLPGLYPYDF